jgi:hypothetical protein
VQGDVAAADPGVLRRLEAGQIDWITVSSSAIARALARLFGPALANSKLASISPITSEVLRQLGYEIIEVPFGGKALKEGRYVNRRTEMWDSVRLWLEQGGSLPDIADLKTDLVTPEYSFDAANRMKLQSNEQIKEKTGKATDLGDALALTFAAPVQPKQFTFRPEMAQGEYNPI